MDINGDKCILCVTNVTITCTRDTFAQFIASALDIPFKEVIKLSYLEVGKKPQKPYLKGQKFDLNGGTLLLYYSDGTQKEIEEGFTVTGMMQINWANRQLSCIIQRTITRNQQKWI